VRDQLIVGTDPNILFCKKEKQGVDEELGIDGQMWIEPVIRRSARYAKRI
jgi:hypothetical protein